MRQYHDAVVLQQVAREKSERAAVQTKLTQHWATHQRVEDSRDADLKCNLKGAVGYSVPEGGPLGPASMQVFQVTFAGMLVVCYASHVEVKKEKKKKTPLKMRSGPLVAPFALQGEGTEEEQRRKEQMKKTGRELHAQREENERRIMREKHRGGDKRQARTPE